jgi:hypothetical protein
MPRVELLAEGSERNPDAAPARSVRRGTARRASNRRATARSRQSDTTARSSSSSLSTRGAPLVIDLAKCLNLNRGNVSTRLTELAKAGEIKRASRGYSTTQAAGLTLRDDDGL